MDAVERADIWKKNRSKRSSGKYALNSTKAYREQEKHHFNSSGKHSSDLEKKNVLNLWPNVPSIFLWVHAANVKLHTASEHLRLSHGVALVMTNYTFSIQSKPVARNQNCHLLSCLY